MKVGVNFDGVLKNIEQYQLKKGRDYFNKQEINPFGTRISEIFKCTEAEEERFWKDNFSNYINEAEATTGISEAISTQINDGDEIFIIVDRKELCKNNFFTKIKRHNLEKWLKQNKIKYNEIIYCDGNKKEKILENNLDVIVETIPKDIEDLCKNTNVICMDTFYNKQYNFPSNVKRISTVYDMYNQIQEIKFPIRDEIKPFINIPSVDKKWARYYNNAQRNVTIPEMTINEYLEKNNEKNPDKIALDYFGNKITFRELYRQRDIFCRSLLENGIKENDVVSICMPNTPEGIIACLAAVKIGAIAEMIHPLSGEEEIKHYLRESNSKVLVTIDTDYDKINNIIDDTNLEHAVVVSPADSMPLYMKLAYKFKEKQLFNFYKNTPNEKFITWDKFNEKYKHNPLKEGVKFTKDKTTILLHTGGSTGDPKSVMLTNEAFVGNSEQLKATIPSYKKGDSLLAITPIFHGFGLSNCVFTPLCADMSVTLLPKYDKNLFRKTLLRTKANLILSVPTLWDKMMKDSEFDNKDLSFLKVIISGGAKLSAENEQNVNKWLKKHNAPNKIFKGYGMTEALAAVSFTTPNANEEESIGVPLPLNNFKILDLETETKELGYNEVGRICISGPTVMAGYYKNDQATSEEIFTDENGTKWLKTGDAGYISDTGVLHYTDRLGRMMTTSGYNVYPSTIEKVIDKHPAVANSVVIATPHPYKGNVPKAYIVLNDGVEPTEELKESIINLCEVNLAKFSIPVQYEFKKELPMTKLGKVDYRLLETQEKENYFNKSASNQEESTKSR